MRVLKYFALVYMVFLVGCGGPPLIQDSTSQVLPPPAKDKAQIVFINPANSIAAAFLTGIYKVDDLQGKDREFYGMLGSMHKLYVNVEPGKHMFMGNTFRISHLLEANVEAGKRYYVALRFIYGRGLQLRPMTKMGDGEFSQTGPKFGEWVRESRFVSKTAQADTWYKDYGHVVDEAQANAVIEWNKKTLEQKAQLTLNSGDFSDKY